MAEEYLALLDSAQRQAQIVHEQVATQLDRSMQLQRENTEFQVGVAMKGLQFAEESRMNDARIHEMEVQNQLRASEFDLRRRELDLKLQEQPLIREARLLSIQATKDERKARIENYKAAQFDKTVSSFNDSMGMFLIGTESQDAAKEYNSLRGQWRNKVANGEEFDSQAYETEMNSIIDKYKDAKPTGVWSPESQMIFGLISPSLERAYQMKNPVVGRNANAVAGSLLTAPADDFTKGMGTLGSLWDDNYRGLIAANRTTYQQNEAVVKNNFMRIREYDDAIQKIDDSTPEGASQKAHYASVMKGLITDNEARSTQNQKIMQDTMSGKLGEVESPPEIKEIKSRLSIPTLQDSASGKNLKPVFSVAPSKDSVFGKVYDGLKKVEEIIDPEKSSGIGKSLDLSWFSDNVTGEVDYATINKIRTSIEKDIDDLDDLDEQFNPENINKLIGNLKGKKSIPINSLLGASLNATPLTMVTSGLRYDTSPDNPKNKKSLQERSSGNTKYEDLQYALVFGKQGGFLDKIADSGKIISSFDDIQSMLKVIDSKSVRERAKRDIFAALVTANINESLEYK